MLSLTDSSLSREMMTGQRWTETIYQNRIYACKRARNSRWKEEYYGKILTQHQYDWKAYLGK